MACLRTTPGVAISAMTTVCVYMYMYKHSTLTYTCTCHMQDLAVKHYLQLRTLGRVSS